MGHVNEQFVDVLLSTNNFNATECECVSQMDSIQNSIECLEEEIKKLNRNSA